MSKSMTEIIQERQRKLAEEQANQQKLAEEKAKKKAEKPIKEKKPRLSPDAPDMKFDDDPAHQPITKAEFEKFKVYMDNLFQNNCVSIEHLEDRIQNTHTDQKYEMLVEQFKQLEQKVANMGIPLVEVPNLPIDLQILRLSFENIYSSNLKRYTSNRATGMLNDLNILKIVFDWMLKTYTKSN